MKRKSEASQASPTSGKPSKKRKTSGRGGISGRPKEPLPEWPEYFRELFKIYMAINTVLGFVSSRKQLATTFPVVRSSVEALLKQPLELVKVAELKALLPDVIKFSYVSQNELRIHGESLLPSKGRRELSPDFSAFTITSSSERQPLDVDDDEHVLVLEFLDISRGKNSQSIGLTTTPSMTPLAVKKLIEKRNEAFRQAVQSLFASTAVTDDPVILLQAAGRAHIPVNPSLATISETKYITTVPEPQDRPSVDDVIVELQDQTWCNGQIIERRTFEVKERQIATLNPPLPVSVATALLASRKISTLYTHQVAAIRAISAGKHVIVSTSTASGKSVIYQVPALKFLEENSNTTAVFIYPTKALAQDQKAAMEQLIYACPGIQHLKVATYDGDTPQDLRAGIRETASIIFTNFDMIHASILPHEELWRTFLKNLKLLAVDELHYYSGLYGSHVAQILRRFRRVCAALGNWRLQFISCSATISNPKVHMKNIFGVTSNDIEAITEDGAPSGRKDFLVWNPALVNPNVPKLGRHSSLSDATRLMRFLMKRGIRVILFCKIRKVCELAMKAIRADLTNEGRYDILERTRPYRGGYSQEDRRRIERDAFNGRLLGIVSTNALELGVDIGVLDAVIMLGFPVNVASFRQQAGRAGRRSRDSLAIFVADALPMDQHYVQNPQEIFEKRSDDLIVDLDSEVLLEPHLQCAAHEMPLSGEDERYFGPSMKEICETHLLKDHEGWYHTHPKFLPYPSRHISIRGAQEEKYAVVNVTKSSKSGGTGSILEEIEISRAMFEIYEGGVFMHQGLMFIVKEVSHDSKLAKVIRADVNWITSPRDYTNVDAMQTYRIKEIKNSPERAYYGKIEVETKVFGFFKIRNNTILDTVDVDTPVWEHETTGLWMDVPRSLVNLLREKGINPAEAIHAAQHAFLNRFPMAQDLRTECKAAEKEYKISESRRKRPARLVFYDAIGKGGGVAATAFDNVNTTLQKACEAVQSCSCEDGCSQCVQSPACKEGNLVCSKLGASLVLKGVLGLKIDPDDIPYQGDGSEDADTIVEAQSVRTIDGVQVEVNVE